MSAGKEVSLEKEDNSTCYLDYRNFDKQKHGVHQCNEKKG